MCEKDLASLSGVGSPTGFLLEDEPFQFPPIPEPAPVCLTGSQSRGEHSANVPCGGRTKLTPWPCLCCSWCLSVGRNLLESCCILIAVTGNLQTILRGQ